MKKYNLLDFFKLSKEETQESAPDGYCPNCWGEQEYDNKIRTLHQDKQIDINNKEANYAFIQEFMVNQLDGIHLKKRDDALECPVCNWKTNI